MRYLVGQAYYFILHYILIEDILEFCDIKPFEIYSGIKTPTGSK